ncbi:MAG: SpoIID/LytB domain-containing protein [Pyrinomonadaceae bacterium]
MCGLRRGDSPSSPLPTPTPPPSNYQVLEIANILSKEISDRALREIKESTGEKATALVDSLNGTWKIQVPLPSLAGPEIEELRARLDNAAYGTVSLRMKARDSSSSSGTHSATTTVLAKSSNIPTVGKPPQAKSPVRLVSRPSAPARELVAYASAANNTASSTPLLTARTPIVFASDDEQHTPLKFNDQLYRGRLEVFANSRGSLTVVNVVSIEDYVRGVVPNELSPGGYPALEALKAQAVAARTYAVANRGLFAGQGFDLLPTTRSQVYRGFASEHPLTNRAVDETRGVIATSQGEPINALYTSTCGGRTEHAENIFGGTPKQVAYLRGRECAAEAGSEGLKPFVLRTTRELSGLRSAEHYSSARDAALLSIHNFKLPTRLTDEWLSEDLSADDARAMLSLVTQLSRRAVVPAAVSVNSEATRPGGWCRALALALDGESRADVLLDRADVDYLLSFRDAADLAAEHRADVALFLRDGFLSLSPDGSLRPRQPMTRARSSAHDCARAGRTQPAWVTESHGSPIYGRRVYPARFAARS